MIEKQLTVINELGIHARVASKVTRCCQAFQSRIEAVKDDKKANLKNVMNVMLLNEKCGGTVVVEFEGEDEEAAALALEQLFADKFGEN